MNFSFFLFLSICFSISIWGTIILLFVSNETCTSKNFRYRILEEQDRTNSKGYVVCRKWKYIPLYINISRRFDNLGYAINKMKELMKSDKIKSIKKRRWISDEELVEEML